jgi:hypothetical protein
MCGCADICLQLGVADCGVVVLWSAGLGVPNRGGLFAATEPKILPADFPPKRGLDPGVVVVPLEVLKREGNGRGFCAEALPNKPPVVLGVVVWLG